MNNSLLHLEIQDFRAISNAQIDLNGITVVSGINGCGKSTISKLLYNVITTSNNYESIVREEFNWNYKSVFELLQQIIQEINRELTVRIDNVELELLDISTKQFSLTDKDDLNDYHTKLIRVINHIETIIEQQLPKEKFEKLRERIYNMLNIKIYTKDYRESYSITSFSQLKAKISDELTLLKNSIQDRTLNTVSTSNFDINYREKLENIKLYELSSPILDFENNYIRNISSIHNCFYIDSPMSIDNKSYNRYWSVLNSVLKYKDSNSITKNDSIIDDIIDGEVEYQKEIFTDRFIYKRNDGNTYSLAECATGIKSFGIIQMLMNKGELKSNTLLIIDEPEAHLHPQWIVEYARIIVHLNKKYGVKFFLTSHNPDMVSAIRYISEKEETLDNVSFYLAKDSGSHKYDYLSIGLDIEPIFSSFNKAYDRVSEITQ